MATAYLAEPPADNRTVALKIPHEHLLHMPCSSNGSSARVLLGATIHHPNIVPGHEVGQVGNHPFIAMEFIQGNTLS